MRLEKRITLGLAVAFAIAAAPFASASDPERPSLAEIVNDFREAQQELVQERRELADSLRGKTTEARRAAIQAYLEANADRIALHRAMSEQIRELMKELRPEMNLEVERPERPDDRPAVERPEVSSDVQELMDQFRATRAALLQERLDKMAELKDGTDEERQNALRDLREQNRDAAEQQRILADQIRDAVHDIREDRRNND